MLHTKLFMSQNLYCGYIRKYDSTKYIASFHSHENFKGIFDRTRYLLLLKRQHSRRLLS